MPDIPPPPRSTPELALDPTCPAIRVMMMPRDTNAHGTIFGGVILSSIDQAGALAARKLAPHKFVTVAMEAVEFNQPVYVGDTLSFFARLEKIGRTSIRIRILVEAERWENPHTVVRVTEASVIYVAVDDRGQKIEITCKLEVDSKKI